MPCYTYVYNIPLSQNYSTRLVTHRHSQRGTYNTRFVPPTLSSCRFQVAVQDPISYIQTIEWNSTTVSKRSVLWSIKVYTCDIHRMFTFDGTKKPHSNVQRENLSESGPRLWNKLPNHFKIASNNDVFRIRF